MKELVAAGNEVENLVKRSQAILASYLPPDGISKDECISQLLGVLDGPEQQKAQNGWNIAKASVLTLILLFAFSSAANAQWTPKPQPVALPKPPVSTVKTPVAKPVAMPKPYTKPEKPVAVTASTPK